MMELRLCWVVLPHLVHLTSLLTAEKPWMCLMSPPQKFFSAFLVGVSATGNLTGRWHLPFVAATGIVAVLVILMSLSILGDIKRKGCHIPCRLH